MFYPPVADIADVGATGHVKPMTWARARPMIAAVLLGVLAGHAHAKNGEEHWIAYSRTAMAITGDILLSPTRLRASGVDFPLRVTADLPAYETHLGRSVSARVLAVTRRMDPKLLNGNTLGCGRTLPIRWIVVWRSERGKVLGMDTFSAGPMPTSSKIERFCGSFSNFRE